MPCFRKCVVQYVDALPLRRRTVISVRNLHMPGKTVYNRLGECLPPW